MKTTFFCLKHSSDGELKFEADDQHVFFSWRRPFDSSEDDCEGIVTSNKFPLKEYLSKVRRLAQGKSVTLPGMLPGHLTLKMVDANHIQITAIDEIGPKSKDEFHITLDAARHDLIPEPVVDTV
jgi:hypothetical protein